ncbi:MAG TPA: alpha-L-arabinofuranosidase, partial [Chitinophagaceae bacterium]|nr:alpha-L-arabinofuranosidase [Chitinophagaceae bacterium]
MNFSRLLLFAVAFVIRYPSVAQDGPITIDANKIITPIQPTMWGVFFEDINMGADGGIYAELVKNRSFEFRTPMMGWSLKGNKQREGDLLIINEGEEKPA